MPKVTIEMFEGRSLEQKQQLVEKVTDAVVEAIDVKPETVDIILNNISKENWAKAGKLLHSAK